MRRIKIVSDSSSDILKLDHVDFASAFMKIITAEREFVDDENLDVDAMVDFFSKYKKRSQTSCPAPADWLDAFGDADDIICVTITSALSGSYNSACTAKKMYEEENEDKRVYVLDTLSAGPEITLIIKKLSELVEAQEDFETICEHAEAYVKKTGLLFMLKSLNNFVANGRVAPIVAKLVGVAGICLVGKASHEGTLEPTHKCRGERRSLETIVDDLEKYGLQSGKVSIGHCQNEKAAEQLRSMIQERFDKVRVDIHKLRGLCSFYAEKGGLLVGYEKA